MVTRFQTEMNSLHVLTESLGPVDSKQVRNKLAQIVKLLSANGKPFVDQITAEWGDTKAVSDRPMVLLHRGNDKFPTIWLLGWRAEETTPIHDHDRSEVAVSVYAGQIGEDVYHASGPVGECRIVSREFHEGSIVTLKAPYVHRMYEVPNEEPKSVTIHAYFPSLDNMDFYEIDGSRLVKTGHWVEEATRE